MTWISIAATLILLALAAAYLAYRLLLGSPFEDPGRPGGSPRRRRWVVASVAIAATAILLLVLRHESLAERWHQSTRRSELIREAGRLPAGGALIIGDSIVEGSGLRRLCGRPLLNAGIGGTGLSDWADYGPRLIQAARPSLVVVALGIADARSSVALADWVADYRQILTAARGSGILLVSLHPVEDGKLQGDAVRPEQVRRFNDALASLARDSQAVLVPTAPSAEGLTTDGAHLNAAGYAGWHRRLQEACAAAPR